MLAFDKPRMSVSAVIDWIGGRLAGSKIGSGEASALRGKPLPDTRSFAAGLSLAASGGWMTVSVSRNTSRLRCDQRDRKFSGSLIDPGPSWPVGDAPARPGRRVRVRA